MSLVPLQYIAVSSNFSTLGVWPRLPLWFKHFNPGPDGAGEAYHVGVFGKTGSGKSVLAKMILTAYARYPQMALLVIDPQGEFSKDVRGRSSGEFQLPLGGLVKSLGKQCFVFSVRNLVLDTWPLFEQILFESSFFERLTIPRGENRQLACEILAEKLQKARVTLANLHTRQGFDKAWELLKDEKTQKVIYKSEGSRARFQSMLDEADARDGTVSRGQARRTFSGKGTWLAVFNSVDTFMRENRLAVST